MLVDIMKKNKFTLLVSLPKNNIEYAIAAMDSGADGVKVHLNVYHYASDNTYGSFEEEKKFLTELSQEVKKRGKIFGLVPGEGDKFASNKDFEELRKLGLDFISAYVEYAPADLLLDKKFNILGAISATSDIKSKNLDKTSIDIVECSIVKRENYRKPLTIYDIARYAEVVKNTNKPVLIPTQKKIKPEEVKLLYDIGCKAIMLGAVVFGNDDLENYKKTIIEFRKQIDIL